MRARFVLNGMEHGLALIAIMILSEENGGETARFQEFMDQNAAHRWAAHPSKDIYYPRNECYVMNDDTVLNVLFPYAKTELEEDEPEALVNQTTDPFGRHPGPGHDHGLDRCLRRQPQLPRCERRKAKGRRPA